MIKANIRFVPGKNDPNKGQMISSFDVKGKGNIVANELVYFLNLFYEEYPDIVLDSIEMFMEEKLKAEGKM